jgi:hypothetical protein
MKGRFLLTSMLDGYDTENELEGSNWAGSIDDGLDNKDVCVVGSRIDPIGVSKHLI